jgi:flagellar export protein FliJ
MAHFVFKLEGVLEQRRTVERQRQRDVAEAQRDVMRLERELHDATIAAAEGSIELRGPIDARLLLAQARFESAMRAKVQALKEQVEAARLALSNAQAALTEAAKQRKVLEKLRENQGAAWAQRQRRREAQASDEVAQRMTASADEIEAGRS